MIDGKIGYTGGMNIADYYITGLPKIGQWHDMHMRIEGDAVAICKVFSSRCGTRRLNSTSVALFTFRIYRNSPTV